MATDNALGEFLRARREAMQPPDSGWAGPGDRRVTGLRREEVAFAADPQYRERVAAITALGRPAEPDDIAPVIGTLLSGDMAWVNGERIEASGGMRL